MSALPEPLIDLLQKKERSKERNPQSNRESKAIQRLKENDPKKYDLLAAFEAKLRRGEVLKNTRILIQFISDIGIDTKAVKSRQAALGRLMKHLADLPVEHASKIIAMAPEDRDPSDSYRRLATYIHKGYDPGPSANPRARPDSATTQSTTETQTE